MLDHFRVTGLGRFRHRQTSLLTNRHEVERMPVRVLLETARIMTGLDLSIGALVAAGRRVPTYADHLVVVHMDETGWREDGHNGNLWTADTPDVCIFQCDTRQKGTVDTLLGDAFTYCTLRLTGHRLTSQ